MKRPARGALAAILTAGLLLGAAACSKNTGDDGDGRTTLVLQTFGNFGYDQAIRDFEAANPDLRVDHQKMGELKDFQPKLVQWLAAGSGAGDVVGLEEGVLLGYLQAPDQFANLFDYGAKELESAYLPWKWRNGLTADGSKLIGLGTDVGGLAMCYRRDLFAKAGLPTEREQVAKLWPTWEAYIDTGRRFAAKKTGAAWLDSATSIVQPYTMQHADTIFFDRQNNFIGDTNPVVRKAWDIGLGMAEEGLTAKLQRWVPDWDAGFQNSAFATLPCPSWMTDGTIKPRAGDKFAGQWDVTTAPGGSGNWGGSYLAVPAQSKHPAEAYRLAKFLTSKEGHLAAFKEAGGMPSTIAALDDPAFKGATSAYFNNAPVGEIFSASVKGMKPVYLGAKHQQVWETIFEPQMQAAERGQVKPDEAWAKAVADAKALTE